MTVGCTIIYKYTIGVICNILVEPRDCFLKGSISHFSPYDFTTLSDFLSPKIMAAFCAVAFTTLQQKFRLKS